MNGKDLYEELDSLYDLRQESQMEYDCETHDILRGDRSMYSELLMDKIKRCTARIKELENMEVNKCTLK